MWEFRYELRMLAYIMEKFLEHGADPHFQFVAERLNDKSWIFRLTVGRECREVLVRYGLAPWILYACEAASLTQFIKIFGFENEDQILHLVERNMKMFDGAVESEQELAALTNVGLLELAASDVEKLADSNSVRVHIARQLCL